MFDEADLLPAINQLIVESRGRILSAKMMENLVCLDGEGMIVYTVNLLQDVS